MTMLAQAGCKPKLAFLASTLGKVRRPCYILEDLLLRCKPMRVSCKCSMILLLSMYDQWYEPVADDASINRANSW